MGSHFKGPVQNKAVEDGDRSWFSELPVGKGPEIVELYNDFLVASDYAAGDWVVSETDAGATQAIAADELNGALVLTNTAGAADVLGLQSTEEFFKMSAGKRAWFETKLKVSADSSLHNLTVGFMTTDTTPLATTDSVGFRKVAASSSILALTEDNTTETTTAVGTLADATYVTLGFYWDGINKVRFYVDRALKATHATNIEQTNKLALTISMTNASAAADTITIDYIYVAMER